MQASGSVTSATTLVPRPPAATISPATASAASAVRSTTTTRAPAAASSSAVARPNPEPPPVTMPARPARPVTGSPLGGRAVGTKVPAPHSPEELSAVDVERLTGDHPRHARREEHDRLGDVLLRRDLA